MEQISKEFGIPIEDIAAIYTDEENGERLIFKRSQIINQLLRVSIKINKTFDEVFEEEFKELSSNLSEVLPVIHIGYMQAHLKDDNLRITCGDLLRNAANTAISAIQTLRCGFRLQSGILLRSVIEMSATVVHLMLFPKELHNFLNDKIKSTKSVSIADKEIPIFVRAWGLLSQKQIHINSLHADWYPVKEYTDKEEIPAVVTIGIIGMVTMILQITTELTYFDNIDEHVYWRSEGENKVSFLPPTEDNISWIKSKLTAK